jgi:tetratricopeptide (TPR) repeat protein
MASETEIRDAYLDAYLGGRSKAERRDRLAQLQAQAHESGYDVWADIIAARIPLLGDRPEEALTLIDELLAVHADNPYALFLKARALQDLPERHAEALQVYEQVCDLVEGAKNVHSLRLLGGAMLNRGVTLGRMQCLDEELEAYQAVIDRFADAQELPLREQVALAMVNRGITLGQMERPDEALKAFQAAIHHFGDPEELGLRRQVAMAMVNRGVALGQMERPDEELQAYQAVIDRYGDDDESPLREQVAMAMVNRGITLEQMERPDMALAQRKRFSGSSEGPTAGRRPCLLGPETRRRLRREKARW